MLWQSSTSRDFSLNPVSLETHGMKLKMVNLGEGSKNSFSRAANGMKMVLKKEKVLYLLGKVHCLEAL